MTIDSGIYYIGDPPMVQMGNITEDHSPQPSCGLNVEHKLTKLGTREVKKRCAAVLATKKVGCVDHDQWIGRLCPT